MNNLIQLRHSNKCLRKLNGVILDQEKGQGSMKKRQGGRSALSPPNGQILDWSIFKAFADDKLNVVRIIISVSDRVENIVEKGENAVTSIFSFSHNVFKRLLSQGRLKSGLCGKELSKHYCQTKAKIFNPLSN